MANLTANGFHFGEIVEFLGLSHLVEQEFTLKLRAGLSAGQSLSEILEALNFSKNVVTQVELVEFHGHLSETLSFIEQNLRQQLTIKKKLAGLLTYPIILLVFLVGIMLGLKNYLLPQLDSGRSWAIILINHLPVLFVSIFVFLSVLTALGVVIFKKKPASRTFIFLARCPFLSEFVRLYLTAYFAREWGNLLAQGVDLKKILIIMRRQKSRIFSEVGEVLTERLEAGLNFDVAVSELEFLAPELAIMIEYGAMKDKLGLELLLYSEECWGIFFAKVERAMQWIQPIVFIFVALMIILLYVAMLLPIYSNMGTMMG